TESLYFDYGEPMNDRTVGDLFPSRREVLKLGGYGFFVASVDGRWALRLAATGKSPHPRGNARNVVFIEISGAISHVESFDFKENAGTPKDLDVRRVRDDLHLSHLLFPRLEQHLNKIA